MATTNRITRSKKTISSSQPLPQRGTPKPNAVKETLTQPKSNTKESSKAEENPRLNEADAREQTPITPTGNTSQRSNRAGKAQNEPNNVPPTSNVTQTRESLTSTDGMDGSFTLDNNNNPNPYPNPNPNHICLPLWDIQSS